MCTAPYWQYFLIYQVRYISLYPNIFSIKTVKYPFKIQYVWNTLFKIVSLDVIAPLDLVSDLKQSHNVGSVHDKLIKCDKNVLF